MEDKPKAIILTKLITEPTAAGRKMLHCIFTNRYGEQQYHYRWIPPWQSKENNLGVEQLFLKALDVERWNDPDGAWSKELDAASQECESLEEVKPVIRITLREVWEEHEDSGYLFYGPGWIINFAIDSKDHFTGVTNDNDELFLNIDDCNIAWFGLKKEITQVAGVLEVLGDITQHGIYDDIVYIGSEVHFAIWADKFEDKIRYKGLTKEIKYRIMNHVNRKLSEYRMLKKGLED